MALPSINLRGCEELFSFIYFQDWFQNIFISFYSFLVLLRRCRRTSQTIFDEIVFESLVNNSSFSFFFFLRLQAAIDHFVTAMESRAPELPLVSETDLFTFYFTL